LSDGDDDNNDDCVMGEDDLKNEDEPLSRFIPVADDVEAPGKASSEMIIPELIVTSARGATAPPVVDHAKAARTSSASASGALVLKRLCIVAKRPDSSHRALEVITMIELPTYRGPHSLVPSEIVFGRLFEASC
jgi:hypothetical protein